MKIKISPYNLFFIILFCCSKFFFGNSLFPEKPINYVTNQTNVLTKEEESDLNLKLKTFEDSSSNQIFIFIANSLQGNSIEEVSQELFQKWKIGSTDKNNGVLIAIFIEDREFRIHTGYGLEGVLPDILTKRIQDEVMRPLFKTKDYFEGIDKGIDKLIFYSKNEYKPNEFEKDNPIGILLFFYGFSLICLIVIYVLAKKIKDKPAKKWTMLIISTLLFLIPFVGSFLLIFCVLITLSMRKDLYNSTSDGVNRNWKSSGSGNSNTYSSSSYRSSSSRFSGGSGGSSGGGGSSSSW
jgi:uncharacterized protein